MIDAKKKSALLLCAMVAVALSGCGDTMGGGTGCKADADCGVGKMCHPTLKSCVASCTGASDCPDGEKTCSTGLGSTAKFCQCSTNELCAAKTAGNVCNGSTLTCTAKCTSDSACSGGGKCNATTGVCGAPMGGGGGDGGMMMGGMACTDIGVCAAGQVCNFTTDKCQGAGSCNAANAQPDNCGTAGVCNAGTCGQVAKATCDNVKAFTYNPKTATGPTIYKIEPVADITKYCKTNQFAHSVKIFAYRTDKDWPAVKDDATAGLKYYTTTGSAIDAPDFVYTADSYKASGKNAEFIATLCPMGGASIVTGFAFSTGNSACADTGGGTKGTTP